MQRCDGAFHAKPGPHPMARAVRPFQHSHGPACARGQRHAAVGGCVPHKGVFARMYRRVLHNGLLLAQRVPKADGQPPVRRRFHGKLRARKGLYLRRKTQLLRRRARRKQQP